MNEKQQIEELKAAKKKVAELEAKISPQALPHTHFLGELILEDVPTGMALLTLDGDVLSCNKEAAAMIGLSPDDLVGKNTKNIYTNVEDKTHIRAILERGKPVKNHEIRLNHTDNSIIWVNLSIRLIPHQGQTTILASFMDISLHKETQFALKSAHEELEEQVRARTSNLEKANEELALLNIKLVKQDREREQGQQALRESEERFRAIFEKNLAIMLLIDPKTGKIKDANPAAESFYGHSSNALKSMRISDINTITQEETLKILRSAKTKERNHFFLRHCLANGEIRDVEVFSGPITVKGQQLLCSIIHDITDRREAERTLQRYERIIASTPDLVSLVDKDYVYRMVNDAYLNTFGKKREDIVDKSLTDLLGKEFFEEISKPNLDRALSGETVVIDSTIVSPSKGTMDVAVTYHPVMNEDGAIDYVSIDARDVTILRQRERALKVYSERLDLATDAGNIGIWDWNVETGELFWDKIMMKLYKIEPTEFNATLNSWRNRVHPDDLAEAENQQLQALGHGKPLESEFRIIWPDGQVRHIKAAALVKRHEEGKPTRMTGVNWDVTKQRTLENELRRLATTDPLTGASNRRSFMNQATQEFSRGHRYDNPMTMLTLDIDHFKKINDTFGHMVGDEILKILVATCKDTLRATDIFARMGGEEFSAILPQTDIKAARLTSERLRKAVEDHCLATEGGEVCYTISIGLSQLTPEDVSIEDIMRRADDALYKAKNSGRNRVESM